MFGVGERTQGLIYVLSTHSTPKSIIQFKQPVKNKTQANETQICLGESVARQHCAAVVPLSIWEVSGWPHAFTLWGELEFC